VIELARVLADRPDEFRVPYPLPAADVRFRSEQLAHWAEHGAVCRAVDGRYWVLDHTTLAMRAVSDAVASVIQQATEEVHHDRTARTA
jgi:trehalose-6-phosphatase